VFGNDLVDNFIDPSRVNHVDRIWGSVDFVGHSRCVFGIDVKHNDVDPICGQSSGEGCTHSGSGTGDDCDGAAQGVGLRFDDHLPIVGDAVACSLFE
jgi:hypothetical protein